MEPTLVARRCERFLVERPAPESNRSALRSIVGTALASIFLHGFLPLGAVLLGRAPEPVSASVEIPIEVIMEAALPAAPAATFRAERPSSLGLEQEEIRAVAVPMPADRGDEALRYDVVVLGRLERAKQFPKQAAQRGARGTAVVGFAVDGAGRVTVTTLLRSSGDEILDVESLAVIRRAAPFPKPPQGARRQFAVDITFGTRG